MEQASRFRPSDEFIKAARRHPRPRLRAWAGPALKPNALAGWIKGSQSVALGDTRFEALCLQLGLQPGEGYGIPDRRQSDRIVRHPRPAGPRAKGQSEVLLKNRSSLRSCSSSVSRSRKSKESRDVTLRSQPTTSTRMAYGGQTTHKEGFYGDGAEGFSAPQSHLSQRQISWLRQDLDTCKTQAEREVIEEMLSG